MSRAAQIGRIVPLIDAFRKRASPASEYDIPEELLAMVKHFSQWLIKAKQHEQQSKPRKRFPAHFFDEQFPGDPKNRTTLDVVQQRLRSFDRKQTKHLLCFFLSRYKVDPERDDILVLRQPNEIPWRHGDSKAARMEWFKREQVCRGQRFLGNGLRSGDRTAKYGRNGEQFVPPTQVEKAAQAVAMWMTDHKKFTATQPTDKHRCRQLAIQLVNMCRRVFIDTNFDGTFEMNVLVCTASPDASALERNKAYWEVASCNDLDAWRAGQPVQVCLLVDGSKQMVPAQCVKQRIHPPLKVCERGRSQTAGIIGVTKSLAEKVIRELEIVQQVSTLPTQIVQVEKRLLQHELDQVNRARVVMELQARAEVALARAEVAKHLRKKAGELGLPPKVPRPTGQHATPRRKKRSDRASRKAMDTPAHSSDKANHEPTRTQYSPGKIAAALAELKRHFSRKGVSRAVVIKWTKIRLVLLVLQKNPSLSVTTAIQQLKQRNSDLTFDQGRLRQTVLTFIDTLKIPNVRYTRTS